MIDAALEDLREHTQRKHEAQREWERALRDARDAGATLQQIADACGWRHRTTAKHHLAQKPRA